MGKWCVHVLGPDDVLPAESRQDSIAQAHAINAATVADLAAHDEEGIHPTVWAVPTTYANVGIEPD